MWILLVAILLTVASFALGQSGPHPGYWRPAGPDGGGLWYECNPSPYRVFAQPDTGKASYAAFDYGMNLVPANDPPLHPYNVPDGQGGGDHTQIYVANDGRGIPICPQSCNNPIYFNWYPAPTEAMRNPAWHEGDNVAYDALAYYRYQNVNPNAPATSSEALYEQVVASKSEWADGNIPAFKAARAAQCSGVPPPTKTPTASPIPTVAACTPREVTRLVTVIVTPTKTPTPIATKTRTATVTRTPCALCTKTNTPSSGAPFTPTKTP
jgi:hypothetical protein